MPKRPFRNPFPLPRAPNPIQALSPSTEDDSATIELTDWNLKLKSFGKFHLQGINRNDPLKYLWTSSPIQKRLDNKSFMTSSKEKIRLFGNMNSQIAAGEEGWPIHLIEKYSKGIPRKWRSVIEQTFGRRFSSVRSPPQTVCAARKVGSNFLMTRSTSKRVKAAITVAMQMKEAALGLILRNVTLLKSACSTPTNEPHGKTTEVPDDSTSSSMVRDDLLPAVTKKPCLVTREENLGNMFHHRQSRAKRQKHVTFSEDVRWFDDVAPSISPMEPIPPFATNKHPPVKLPMVKLTQEALSHMQNCCVVLRDIKSKIGALPARDESDTENKAPRKVLKRTKSRRIIIGNKMRKLKPTAAGNLQIACVEQAERPKLNKDMSKRFDAITAKPGTLKHRQQMRQFLKQHSNNSEETDFLSKEKPNELIGEFIANEDYSPISDDSSDSDGETPRRPNVTMAPVSERKTPAESTFSLTYHRKRNRQHIDKYVLQRKAEMKLNARRPAILKPTVIKRKPENRFIDIPAGKMRLLSRRLDSDKDNMEDSNEEN